MCAMTVGSRVTDRWGEPGVLSVIYQNFAVASRGNVTMTPEQWLEQQTIPFSPDQLEEPWGAVDCDSGGVTIGPLSAITLESPG
jgi:hypothetical protein